MNKKLIKKIDDLIKDQKKFIKQVELTLLFMEVYRGNMDDCHFLFGDDIIIKYRFDWSNPEWITESFDELAFDIINEEEKFSIVGNGLFASLHLKETDRKYKLSTADSIIEYYKNYSKGESWEI